MTIEELIESLKPYDVYILIAFVAVPVITLLYGLIAKGDKAVETRHKYVYAVLVYLTSVPGMMSSVLTAYVLFIEEASLLRVEMMVYFAPIVSMVATVFIMKRNVDLNRVPGFDRLYGLFIVLALTFALTLGVIKMRIWIFFGGSILSLLIIIVVLFAVLQVGMRKLFRPKSEIDKLE